MRETVKKSLIVAALWMAVLLLMCLAGCRSVKYVPVESVRTDSIYLTQIQRDSIVKYDSIYVRDKGDTVWLEKYRYVYRDRAVRDTVYLSRIDTLRVPYPVEKQLSKWEKIRLEVGGYAIFAVITVILIVVGYMVYKLKKGG